MSVPPKELSLFEIRRFMLDNNCRVTNHALVKHFKKFLTNTETANEARKKLKTYANILATIKVEDNQKFLILRKKYLHECPTEDEENKTVEVPPSPGGNDSVDAFNSPFRQPPPYKEPRNHTKIGKLQRITEIASMNLLLQGETAQPVPPALPPKNKPISRQSSVNDEDKENISISSGFTVSSGAAVTPVTTTDSEKSSAENNGVNENSDVENPISVKEATRKFNRMASQEESKILSPPNKKKVEKIRGRSQPKFSRGYG
uniref:SOWAHA-C winged helix-turn-helix domain-containing protein n=1 Tax=Megaselia scalaris TaxID=36166 RepID=T1GN74_MEGSC